MANDLTKSVWVIDTANAAALTSDWVKVNRIKWDGEGSTGGENAVVTDAGGGIIFYGTAAGTNYSEAEWIGRWVRGLIVPTLGVGKLYIDFE